VKKKKGGLREWTKKRYKYLFLLQAMIVMGIQQWLQVVMVVVVSYNNDHYKKS